MSVGDGIVVSTVLVLLLGALYLGTRKHWKRQRIAKAIVSAVAWALGSTLTALGAILAVVGLWWLVLNRPLTALAVSLVWIVFTFVVAVLKRR